MLQTLKNINLSISNYNFKKILYKILFVLIFSAKNLDVQSQVVINELGIAPNPGSNNVSGEFIELYNKGGCAVDISCYILLFSGTSGSGNPTGWTITIPSGRILLPCDYFLIGGSGVTAFSSGWANTNVGGNPWINLYGTNGKNTADLDISTTKNTTRNNLAPGTLANSMGQITLLNSSGSVVSSVSYNNGNNSGAYPGFSNTTSTDCTPLNTINNPGDAINNVNATFASSNKQGIYLNSSGGYSVENDLTPGMSNALNNGTQTCCAPTITTASNSADVCFSNTQQITTLSYSATTNSPITYSITWNASPANNFINISNATLTANSITIVVPAATSAGTYTGIITVSNAGGCISCSKNFIVTVAASPSPIINHN